MKKLILLSLLCTITYNGQVGISMESSLDNLKKEPQDNNINNIKESQSFNNINNIQDENIINYNNKMNEQLFNPTKTLNIKTRQKLVNKDNNKRLSMEDIITYLNSNNALTFSVENILDLRTIDNPIASNDCLRSFEEWSYNYLKENYTKFILEQYEKQRKAQDKSEKNDNDFIDSVIKKLKGTNNIIWRFSNVLLDYTQYARHIIHNNIYAILLNNIDTIEPIKIKSHKKVRLYDTSNNIRSNIISCIANPTHYYNQLYNIAAALVNTRRIHGGNTHYPRYDYYDLKFLINHPVFSKQELSDLEDLITNGYITNPKTMEYIKLANVRRYLKTFNIQCSTALNKYQNNIMQDFDSRSNDNRIINDCITFLNKYFCHAGNKSGQENQEEIALIVLRAPKYLIFTRNIIQNKIYNIAVDHYLNKAKEYIQQLKAKEYIQQLSDKYYLTQQSRYEVIQVVTNDIKNDYRRTYIQNILNLMLSSEYLCESTNDYYTKEPQRLFLSHELFNSNLSNKELMALVFKSINPTMVDYFEFYEIFNKKDVLWELDNNLHNVNNNIEAITKLKDLIDEGYLTNPYCIQYMKKKYNYQNSELDNQYPGTGSNTIIEGKENKSENSDDNELVDNSQNNKNIMLNNNINNEDIKENNNLINNINDNEKSENKINEDIINNNILVDNNEIKNNINTGIKREFVNNNTVPEKDNKINNNINEEIINNKNIQEINNIINNIINNENKINEDIINDKNIQAVNPTYIPNEINNEINNNNFSENNNDIINNKNISNIIKNNTNKDNINEINIEEGKSKLNDKSIKNDKESINNIINNNNLNKDTNTSVNNNNNMKDNTIEQNKDLKFENLAKIMRKSNNTKFKISTVNEFLTKLSTKKEYKEELRKSLASLKSKDDRSIYKFLKEKVFTRKDISITPKICQAIIAYFDLLPQNLEKK